MSKFIFVRHGQSQANAAGLIATDDSPLTPQGIAEATKTAHELRDMGIKVVVCSPMPRAQLTAEIIAGEIGVDLAHIKVINELREREAGKLRGKAKTHESEWYLKIDTDHGFESRADLITRMKTCLNKLKAIAKKEGVVLAVGHAASGYYLLEVAKGKTKFEEFEFDPGRQINNADFIEVEV